MTLIGLPGTPAPKGQTPPDITAGTVIDITPSWAGVLPGLIAVLQNGSAEGQRIAKHELASMARAADAYNEIRKG